MSHLIEAGVLGIMYNSFGNLLMAMILQIIVISLLSCISTYVQLCSQNYNWWWRSFIIGASGSIFIAYYTVSLWKKWHYKNDTYANVISALYFTVFVASYICATGYIGVFASYRFVKSLYNTKRSTE